jgi:hypothetical protein
MQNRKSHFRQVLRAPVLATSLAMTAVSATGILTTVAHAQNTNATIRGQVLDPSGALIPNATISILNTATNVKVFDGTSDSGGSFVAPQVIPGTYTLTVSAPGLKTTTINNVIATVSQVTALNVTMQLGESAETVTVEAKGEQLDKSTSNVSTLISPSDVQNLPLNQRNVENLLAFVPGVATGGNPTTVNTAQLSINGSRTLNSEVLLNGVSTIVASTGQPALLPSPDGIDELRFLTSNAPAEYGRTSGAVLSANTRSGTNQFHGAIYSLVRNEALNANSYFNKLVLVNGAPQPRGRNRFFQFGGAIGGPVWIPHVFDGHDKVFFFVNYDRQIQRSTGTSTITVPGVAERTGDFSASPQKVYMPGTSTAPGTNTPQYAGNKITSGIDPAAAKILSLMPLPNTPGTFDAANGRYTNNYTQQNTTSPDQTRLVARVDAQATKNDRMSFNLYRLISKSPNAVVYNVPLLNTNFDCSCSDAWIGSIGYTHTWSSTLVSDFNMGFFRNNVRRNPPGAGLGASAALGIASLPLDQTPQITYTGYNNVGADTNTNQINITNTFSPYVTITKTYGEHNFRFGGQLRKNQFNSYNPSGSPQGSIAFNGTMTNHGATGNPTTGLADFLTGKIATANYQLPMPPTGRRNWNLAFFFQDDWKALPNLTINAGIRYEYEAPIKIANDVYSRFDPNTGLILRAGVNASESLNIQTPKANFSPRVGLAWSLDNKTVIRAAFGTFYGTIFQNLGGQIAFPGYDQTQTSNALGTATPQAFALNQGLPLTLTPDVTKSFAAIPSPTDTSKAANPYSISGISFDKLSPMPMVQQWNAGIQRQLPLSVTLEVNYVGNHGLHLPYNIPVNLVPINQSDAVTLANTTAAQQLTKPFPALQTFSVVRHAGMSNYNSLQVSGRRQFNTRLKILSSYTYAKALDDGSTIYNFSAPNGTANAQYVGIDSLRKQDYAVSNIDIKHRVNVAMQYTTGGPWWLRGWNIAPAFVGQTGLPVNITQNNLVPNVSQQRPNGRAKDVVIKPYFDGTVLRYFKKVDPTAVGPDNYPLTPSGPLYATINGTRTRILSSSLGTMPRDAARAFGLIQFDASLSKSFDVYKAVKLQLRVDAFNVLNHTNFNAPNGSLTAAADQVGTSTTWLPDFRAGSNSFGTINGTQPSRNLQLQGRITF